MKSEQHVWEAAESESTKYGGQDLYTSTKGLNMEKESDLGERGGPVSYRNYNTNQTSNKEDYTLP